MKIVIRFSAKQESQALPILLRHQPGMVLPNRTYVLSEETVQQLIQEGIEFTEISRESSARVAEGAIHGERV